MFRLLRPTPPPTDTTRPHPFFLSLLPQSQPMLRSTIARGAMRTSLSVSASLRAVPQRAFAAPSKTKTVSTVREGEVEVDGQSLKKMKALIEDFFSQNRPQFFTLSPEDTEKDKVFVEYCMAKMARRKRLNAALEQRKINVKNLTVAQIPPELRDHALSIDTEPWPVYLMTPCLTPPARDWIFHHYRQLDISRDELYRRLAEDEKRREEQRKEDKIERRRKRQEKAAAAAAAAAEEGGEALAAAEGAAEAEAAPAAGQA